MTTGRINQVGTREVCFLNYIIIIKVLIDVSHLIQLADSDTMIIIMSVRESVLKLKQHYRWRNLIVVLCDHIIDSSKPSKTN